MEPREIIAPRDEAHWLELRSQNINSTESPALLGLSPYLTHYELWHRHANKISQPFELTERITWGKRLQDAIAKGVAEDNGWHDARPMPEYMRYPRMRMGASFDWAIGDQGLLEVKVVDSLQFRDNWVEDDDGNIEAPPGIELQVQHQLAVSGRQFAFIAALVGGNRIVLLERVADKDIMNHLAAKVVAFWSSVDMKQEPKPDFIKDAAFIAKLYGYAEPGKVKDASAGITDLAKAYAHWAAAEKEASEQKASLKAQMLMEIDDAEKVIGDGFSISAGTVDEKLIESYTRKSYRNFRVNWKKEKSNG